MARPPRVPRSWFPVPCSLFLVPCSLFHRPLLQCGALEPPMPERTVSLDKSGPVARLTLRRPSVDAALLAELARACDAIESDDSVHAVILAAEGADFCRGWDESLLAGEGGPAVETFGSPAKPPR